MRISRLVLKKQKGAMFGLDARIALAIFGALSILAGVFLYNTLNKLEATKLLVHLKEIAKAYEQYYFDTSIPLPRWSSNPAENFYYVQDIGKLVDDFNIKDWKGPYISLPKFNIGPGQDSLSLFEDPSISITINQITKNNTWAVNSSKDWSAGRCEGTADCYLWLRFGSANFKEEDLFKKLDELVDNNDGQQSGKMRWYYWNADKTWRGYYMFMPYIK